MELSPASSRLFSAALEAHTGQKIAAGRRWRIDVALAVVMKQRGLGTLDEVAAQISGGRDPRLAETVVEALLNNETSFFRDPGAWDLFAGTALPRLIAARGAQRRLRLWCAGCSTGQEAYSLAMLLEEMPAFAGWRIEIVATDVSHAAIAQARGGRYGRFEIQRGLPVRRMIRWFDQDGEHWRANEALRRRVRFRQHSLLDPPPAPGQFDAILCRNVLLYFAAPIRTRVFDRLAASIAGDGVLVLGAGETVIGRTERFTSDADARGLYRPAA